MASYSRFSYLCGTETAVRKTLDCGHPVAAWSRRDPQHPFRALLMIKSASRGNTAASTKLTLPSAYRVAWAAQSHRNVMLLWDYFAFTSVASPKARDILLYRLHTATSLSDVTVGACQALLLSFEKLPGAMFRPNDGNLQVACDRLSHPNDVLSAKVWGVFVAPTLSVSPVAGGSFLVHAHKHFPSADPEQSEATTAAETCVCAFQRLSLLPSLSAG